PAGTLFKSINFGGADYVLSGNQINVSDGIITTNLNATNTVNLAVQLNSNQAFRCTSGRLILGGNIALGSRTLTTEAIGDIGLSGVISGTGGIVKTNSGTLSLLGASPNTYSGATILNEGTL